MYLIVGAPDGQADALTSVICGAFPDTSIRQALVTTGHAAAGPGVAGRPDGYTHLDVCSDAGADGANLLDAIDGALFRDETTWLTRDGEPVAVIAVVSQIGDKP